MTILLDDRHLESFRRRLECGEPAARSLLAELERSALNAVAVAPPAVVDKDIVPPSGDVHDYLSQAPYWWPDPSRPDGRPYVRRDGQRNPEARLIGDRGGLAHVIAASSTLGLAYHFTGRREYATQLVRLVRRWFLDPATAMRPHLRYAQVIPGVSQGRSLGIIETALLPDLFDGVELVAASGEWTESDQSSLEAWMGTFLRWLVDSPAGRAEGRSGMNHETWYAVQVAGIALFVGDDRLARRVLEGGRRKIARQIEPDGRQPKELARALPWHYSAYNLSGMFNLALMGERVGIDLWRHRTRDGRCLRTALDYLVPFAAGDLEWTLHDINGFRPEALHRLLRRAAMAWAEPGYRRLAAEVGGSNPRVEILMSWDDERDGAVSPPMHLDLRDGAGRDAPGRPWIARLAARLRGQR